jgi:hypothetical protein
MRTVVTCSLLSLLLLYGCTKEAHLYDLTTGAQTLIRYSANGRGRGTLTGQLATRETLKGEYTTVVNAAVGWGSIYSGVYSATGTSVAVGGSQRGSAVMTGDKGLVLNCEYISSAWNGHGTGACEDNHGTKYKLMF